MNQPTAAAVATLLAGNNVANSVFVVRDMTKLNPAVQQGPHTVDHTCRIEDGTGQILQVFLKSGLRVDGHFVGSTQARLESGCHIRLTSVDRLAGAANPIIVVQSLEIVPTGNATAVAFDSTVTLQ